MNTEDLVARTPAPARAAAPAAPGSQIRLMLAHGMNDAKSASPVNADLIGIESNK